MSYSPWGSGGASTYGGGGNPGPMPPQSPGGIAPPSPVGGQVNDLNNLYGMFGAGVLGPANAQADNTLANLGIQQGVIDANYGLQSGALGNQLQSGLARIGIEQGALGRQQAFLPQQEALQRQAFGLDRQDLGLSRQGLDLQRQMAQFQSGQQTRGAWSNSTARGATNTSGFGQQLSDIGTQLQERLQGIGLDEQRLDLQGSRIGIQEQQYNLSASEQEAALGDRAKSLGLDKSDLQNRIDTALSQLGLNKAVSTIDIINAMNDAQNGRINALSSVLGQIGQIDPRLLMGTGGG